MRAPAMRELEEREPSFPCVERHLHSKRTSVVRMWPELFLQNLVILTKSTTKKEREPSMSWVEAHLLDAATQHSPVVRM